MDNEENLEFFCENCNTKISKDDQVCPNCGAVLVRNSHKWSIILGYITSIFFGIFGFIFAIYNMTRSDENTKFHGKIQLLISISLVLIGFFLIGLKS